MTTVNRSATQSIQRLGNLPSHLEDHPGFRDVVTALRNGARATIDGLWGSADALLATALLRHAPARLVVIWPTQEAADRGAEDLRLFAGGKPTCFPACDPGSLDFDPLDDVHGIRLRTVKSLCQTERTSPVGELDRLIVASMPSLMQPVPTAAALGDGTRRWCVGDSVDLETLRRWLVDNQFQATSQVQLPGEFSVRGGILDIFALDWEQPVRIELFGDEIESIRQFDVATQRSLAHCTHIELTVYHSDRASSASILASLPEETWYLLIEPEAARAEANQYYERLPDGHGCFSEADVMRDIMACPLATASSIAAGSEAACCRLRIESIERFSGEIGKVRDELDQITADHEAVIVADSDAERKRLMEIFGATRLASDGRLQLVVGILHAGFRLVPERLVLLSGAELFHRTERPRVPRRRLGRAIDSFMDLTGGDLVVHVAHGIGRYRGLKMLTKGLHVEEHLEIEFEGGTKLYVPAAKIDLVQKYVGGSQSRPRLARIGGTTWVRRKQAAEAAVTDMAAEMLELQAARAARPGIAFAPDSEWQQEFDSAFPYTETPDQLSALEAVREDMLAMRPMDRLLCGDVGYGKTEVAMRAAFKAVDCGYQVAVLVPTTILAEQHYRTFQQRMAEFPIDIARLSRFCSGREQRTILEELRRGRIDVVIGTHRLVSADVRFHNLGLIVIDEEQRFGVEVKERLKQLRSTVDVMTMTATPIPRTLHMSLVGVRDISNLETPPAERMAIQTRVTRFDTQLIRAAVLRELNRGGQVFFVHNRVHDIQRVAQRLEQIVPEASIRVGHGQMRESELEQVMLDFVQQRFDVLLATTIVESGLDIPNANTMFIDDADRYGLADLHQLRGRVGRYRHRAYCYLLIDPSNRLTPNAARRLRAIEEFSHMGAGFAIAMRDLEIRGAGNLLGTQQSGHITAIGYELYCQLLENAVRHLKRLPPRRSLDVDIHLPGEAYLPSDYVRDLRVKVDLYRRLTRVTQCSDLDHLADEMRDRFGPAPPPVERLLTLTQLKIDAARWRVAALYVEEPYLVFEFTERSAMAQLARQTGNRLRIVDDHSAYLPVGKELTASPEILDVAKSVLRSEA